VSGKGLKRPSLHGFGRPSVALQNLTILAHGSSERPDFVTVTSDHYPELQAPGPR